MVRRRRRTGGGGTERMKEDRRRRRRCLARWSRGGDELKATSSVGSKRRRPDLSESEEDEMCGATRGWGE
jgi:hypothetical protein